MTQLELEQQFDMSDRKETLAEIYANSSLKVSEQTRITLKQALGNIQDNTLDNILIDVIMISAIESTGVKVYHIHNTNRICDKDNPEAVYQDKRVLPLSEFFQSLMGTKTLSKLYASPSDRFEAVINVAMHLQEELYEVEVNKKIFFDDTNEWKTITRVVFFDLLPLDLATKADFEFHRPPMISVPIEWEEHQRGGYVLNKSQAVKKRGHNNQPASALKALNVQQSMAWELNKYCSFAEEVEFVTKKSKESIQKSESLSNFSTVEELVLNRTTTLAYTRNLMASHDTFYFEWRYDFRGRMYTTAYNLNPQGDKYKKGAINGKPNIYS